MGEPATKKKKLASSIIRNHSPYCEAVGPIVQQGFVAARVRAIQGSYHETQQGTSYPLIVPDSVRGWPQSIKLRAPPLKPSLASRVDNINRTPVNTKEPLFHLLHPVKNRSGSDGTTGSNNTTRITVGTSAANTADEDGRTILSPQAIPASLAKSAADWTLPHCGEKCSYRSPKVMPWSYPRRSVADRLGSMASNGSVRSGFSGEAYNDQRSSSACTLSVSNGTAPDCKHPFQSEGSHGEALPRQRYMKLEKQRHSHSDNRRSAEQARASFRHHQPRRTEHSDQCMRGYGAISSGHIKEHAKSDGSGVCERTCEEWTTQRPGKGHQVRLTRSPLCSTDFSRHQLHPGKVSLSREIDRQMSECGNKSNEGEDLKVQQDSLRSYPTTESYEGQSDLVDHSSRSDCLSLKSSTRSSGASCTPTIHESKRSLSRSTSWFAKLAGYKLVLVDKTPHNRVLSWHIGEPSLNVERRHHQQWQHHHHQHPQPRRQTLPTLVDKAETVDQAPFSLQEQETWREEDIKSPKLEQLPEDGELRQGAKDGEALASVPKSDRTFRVISGQHSGSESSPEPHALHAGSTPHKQVSESQQTPSASPSERQRSTPGPDICQTSNTARIDSKMPPVRDASPAMSMSAASERLQEGSSGRSPLQKEPPGAEAGSDGSQAPPRSFRVDESSSQPSQTFSWQATGREREFKRVQVTISLDGANDVSAEGILLKSFAKVDPPVAAPRKSYLEAQRFFSSAIATKCNEKKS